MPNMKAVMFLSQGSDPNAYVEALRRVGCLDPKRVYSPDDISISDPADVAIVEIFDYRMAAIHKVHLATDASPGVRMLRCIRDRWPNCIVLGISNTKCVNGSSYVEGALLVDWAVAVNWVSQESDPALNQESLIANALNRAMEAHPIIRGLRFPDTGAVKDAQPAA